MVATRGGACLPKKWAESPRKPRTAGRDALPRVAAEAIGRPKPVEIIEDPDFVGAILIKKAEKC
jgi:hypothetical protein